VSGSVREVLLYNAGSGMFGTITDITPEQYEDSWRINAYGAFQCEAVVPDLIARGVASSCLPVQPQA
jgi:NAD(P)-dependent dehydrogenase (short-subunit alcohol dehydrogenase family)